MNREENEPELLKTWFAKKWILKMFSPCILVIDDNVKLLVKLEATLRQAGYRVLTAHDGRQGAHLAQAALPEVIVCNAKMPSLNGSDVRGILARDSRTASIPCIFLTKSLNQHELVARVNAVIRSRSYTY
jgi:DNA-binding response OmpR family regulator